MTDRNVESVLDLVRPSIREMSPYVGGVQISDYENWAKLNQNEFPYPPAPRVLEVLDYIKTHPHLLHRYPPGDHKELKKRLSAYLKIQPEQISFGNGSDEVLQNIGLVFLDKGDRYAYGSPDYSMWPNYQKLTGSMPVIIELPDGYTLPIDEIIKAKPKLATFSGPNTPSGAATPIKDLDRLVAELDGIFVDDEAYADFAEDDALELVRSGRYPNLIVTRTFSKAFGLAAERLGYALGHPDIISRVEAVRLPYNVTIVTYLMGLAALEPESIEHTRKLVGEIKAERAKLTQDLTELGFYVRPSQANFVLARGRSPAVAKMLYDRLAENKVLVRYFDSGRLSDCLRITVGTPEENERLLEKIRELSKQVSQ
ncbi:MAG: aminotransferase class I/II-fold pyridoxal phosphate-dependent enzyme [Candidatus Aenigmarchaeota archaeon]|nr:aminotransferase class I/II-fold pyridoxal phosphate-dependent enzyme [Candidatus Aenigmarchaeota archaeon]